MILNTIAFRSSIPSDDFESSGTGCTTWYQELENYGWIIDYLLTNESILYVDVTDSRAREWGLSW